MSSEDGHRENTTTATMAVRTMEEHLLGNKWQEVIHAERLWPGEYQRPVDDAGNPHNPWGMNVAYFECCTGTPCADSTRATAYMATKMPPADMAEKLAWLASLHGKTFEVQVSHARHYCCGWGGTLLSI